MKPIHLFSLAALVATLATSCKKDDDPVVPYVPPCTYTVGDWGPWVNGVRSRSVTASPDGCTGTAPASTQTHVCVSLNRSYLAVRNYSTNPYQVTITGGSSVAPFTLSGGELRDSIVVNPGFYSLHSEQLSGFVLYPSLYDGSRNLSVCEKYTWSFP